jgi:hypothetical protein
MTPAGLHPLYHHLSAVAITGSISSRSTAVVAAKLVKEFLGYMSRG